MKLDLALQNIPDQIIRENFFRLLNWIALNPLLNSDLKFFEIDLAAAGTKVPIPHGLDFIPLDIIKLSAQGDNRYYFHFQAFDKTNIYITNSGPVRIRFLLGKYVQPGLKSASVEYPFVAPT